MQISFARLHSLQTAARCSRQNVWSQFSSMPTIPPVSRTSISTDDLCCPMRIGGPATLAGILGKSSWDGISAPKSIGILMRFFVVSNTSTDLHCLTQITPVGCNPGSGTTPTACCLLRAHGIVTDLARHVRHVGELAQVPLPALAVQEEPQRPRQSRESPSASGDLDRAQGVLHLFVSCGTHFRCARR